MDQPLISTLSEELTPQIRPVVVLKNTLTWCIYWPQISHLTFFIPISPIFLDINLYKPSFTYINVNKISPFLSVLLLWKSFQTCKKNQSNFCIKHQTFFSRHYFFNLVWSLSSSFPFGLSIVAISYTPFRFQPFRFDSKQPKTKQNITYHVFFQELCHVCSGDDVWSKLRTTGMSPSGNPALGFQNCHIGEVNSKYLIIVISKLDGDSTFPSESTNINTDNETSSPSLGHSGSNTNSTSSHPSWIKKAKVRLSLHSRLHSLSPSLPRYALTALLPHLERWWDLTTCPDIKSYFPELPRIWLCLDHQNRPTRVNCLKAMGIIHPRILPSTTRFVHFSFCCSSEKQNKKGRKKNKKEKQAKKTRYLHQYSFNSSLL